MSQVVGLPNNLYKPITNMACVHARLCKLQQEAQWAEPVSLTFHSALRKLNTEPPIGASHQAVTEKKIFRCRPIRNKNGLWRPCL